MPQTPSTQKPYMPHLRYALVLQIAKNIGFTTLLIFFLLYLSGAIPLKIPLNQMPHYWSLPAQEYFKEVGFEQGWRWLAHIGYGDFLVLLPIAFLSGVTMLCYSSVLPLFWRNGDKAYFWIALAEIFFILSAASGIFVIEVH